MGELLSGASSFSWNRPTRPPPPSKAKDAFAPAEIDENLTCPISFMAMSDPVVAEDGMTYERSKIEQWFTKSSKSPMTGAPLKTKSLIPNNAMRSRIQQLGGAAALNARAANARAFPVASGGASDLQAAVEKAGRAGHKWFADLSPATQERVLRQEIPVLLVIGETGTGKSCAINRMTTSLASKRSSIMPEGDGAAAGTAMTAALLLPWLGDENCPIVCVDMPGLNDPEGKDLSIIRDACQFLTTMPCPVAHQIVLVVDGTNPRLSKPLKEVIRVLRDVFDEGGKNGFVDHLTVMFTKIPYAEWSCHEREDFEGEVKKKKKALSDSWADRKTGLSHEEILNLDSGAAENLKRRFLFVNNALPPKMLKQLQNDFQLQPDLGLGDIYARALYFMSNPFRLVSLNDNVQLPSTKRALVLAEWIGGVHAAVSKIHATGPFDEDAFERRISPIFAEKLRELDSMDLGDMLPHLKKQLDALLVEQERVNETASVVFNEALATRLVEQCKRDITSCRREAKEVSDAADPTVTVHSIYHRFYDGARYYDRFIEEKKGTIDSAIASSERLRNETTALTANLRDEIFGADFVEKQIRESKLHATQRRCPKCRIAWQRDAGCKNVRCGWSQFSGESGKVVTPAPAPRTGKVHGCGSHFDWDVAANVSEAEERSFWLKTPETIEAERQEEAERQRRHDQAAKNERRRAEERRRAVAFAREAQPAVGGTFGKVGSMVSSAWNGVNGWFTTRSSAAPAAQRDRV